MMVKPMIFNGDDRVLQVGRDFRQRDVMPLLVEPEPRLTVGAVKDGIADAASQPVDLEGVP